MAAFALSRSDSSVPSALSPPTQRGASRRWLRAATGAIVIAVGAVAGALAFSTLDHQKLILVSVRTVQPGEVITAGDIGVAKISGSGLAVLPAAARWSVIGQRSSVLLNPGSPLISGDFSLAARTANQVELPMTLKQGDLPPGLAQGDTVLVVPTPDQSTPAAVHTGPPVTGIVENVAKAGGFGQDDGSVVSVLVPRNKLVRLAEAAANGDIVLAREHGR